MDVPLKLMTTFNLATILQRPFFNLLHKIIQFSDSFCGDQKCLNQDCTVQPDADFLANQISSSIKCLWLPKEVIKPNTKDSHIFESQNILKSFQ